MELSGRASEAAFALVNLFLPEEKSPESPGKARAKTSAEQEEEEGETPSGQVRMEWDEPEFNLPVELAVLWQ